MVEMEKRLRGKLKLTVQSKTVFFFSYCLYNSCLQIVFQLFFLSLPSHAHPSSFTVSFRDANSWASLLRHFWFFFVSPQCPFFSSFSFLLPQFTPLNFASWLLSFFFLDPFFCLLLFLNNLFTWSASLSPTLFGHLFFWCLPYTHKGLKQSKESFNWQSSVNNARMNCSRFSLFFIFLKCWTFFLSSLSLFFFTLFRKCHLPSFFFSLTRISTSAWMLRVDYRVGVPKESRELHTFARCVDATRHKPETTARELVSG